MNDMTNSGSTAYDRISYPGHPFVETHPDHLATLGYLFGMSPTPLDRCRVLELGCGDGANLIPVAFQWPDSEFVGLDLSAQAVSKGNEFIARVGLKNITLRACDIMDVSKEFGKFDYIVSHGVYSWVPAPVRAKMLSILHENLTPQGIGYISYNCYPGCHARDIAREMMNFHARGVTDPVQRVAQGRALLKLMAQTSDAASIYGFQLRDQLSRIEDIDDAVLFHDDLSEVATPFYLHQVAEDAALHRLQYLCDATFALSQFNRLPAQAREALASISIEDGVAREQYADFIEGRAFRQSLFCHGAVRLRRDIDPHRLRAMSLATSAVPSEGGIDVAASGVVTFKTENGSTLATDHRLSKAVIRLLGRVWPQTVPFEDALQQALRELGPEAEKIKANLDEEVDALARLLFRVFCAGQFGLHLFPPQLTTAISERPRASPLARHQAQTALSVTNLRHRTVGMQDETVRRFLMLVDGTRTLDELVTDLNAAIGARDNGAVPRQAVEQNLGLLAKLGLLAA